MGSLRTSQIHKIFRCIWGGMTLLIHMTTHAAIYETLPTETELPGEDKIQDFEGEGGVTSILANIIEKGIDITAMLAVIAICIVGLMFITSAGDVEKAKKASKYAGIILA